MYGHTRHRKINTGVNEKKYPLAQQIFILNFMIIVFLSITITYCYVFRHITGKKTLHI